MWSTAPILLLILLLSGWVKMNEKWIICWKNFNLFPKFQKNVHPFSSWKSICFPHIRFSFVSLRHLDILWILKKHQKIQYYTVFFFFFFLLELLSFFLTCKSRIFKAVLIIWFLITFFGLYNSLFLACPEAYSELC